MQTLSLHTLGLSCSNTGLLKLVGQNILSLHTFQVNDDVLCRRVVGSNVSNESCAVISKDQTFQERKHMT